MSQRERECGAIVRGMGNYTASNANAPHSANQLA